MDNLQRFLRTRRSIRLFKSDPIPAAIIQCILETALFAPSAHNSQPWRFCVVKDSSQKTHLAESMAAEFRRDLEKDGRPEPEIIAQLDRSRQRIIEAPLLVILCADIACMDEYPDSKRQRAESIMVLQSTALAGLQLLLAAHAEGLGGVWTCGPLFTPKTVRSALSLPKSWKPQAMFFLGYPAESPALPERKSLDEVILYR